MKLFLSKMGTSVGSKGMDNDFVSNTFSQRLELWTMRGTRDIILNKISRYFCSLISTYYILVSTFILWHFFLRILPWFVLSMLVHCVCLFFYLFFKFYDTPILLVSILCMCMFCLWDRTLYMSIVKMLLTKFVLVRYLVRVLGKMLSWTKSKSTFAYLLLTSSILMANNCCRSNSMFVERYDVLCGLIILDLTMYFPC